MSSDWQEKCKIFLDEFTGKRFVVRHDLTERKTCYVDIKTPEFDQYAERHDCQTQSAYGIEYIPEKRVVWGEFLIGHCPTKKQFQSFLLTPAIDLSEHCKIEQVHVHSGEGCPTTHVHVHCEVPEGKPIRTLLHNIAWMAEKLDAYMKATCEK